MTIDIYTLTADGQVNAGSVWLEDGRIQHKAAKPEFENLLTNLAEEDFKVNGVDISPQKTPEERLKKLPMLLSGAYLTAAARPDRANDRRTRLHRALDRILIRKRA